ncbi:unnamed protein product [Phytophthora fragariaefolia]|uniref:Unnamed protein product n=1 Tax=Phytophthora fragariaefolia TaxID=1490495 RepID=A0A9W6X221_9STRA|nr:unnamed protein product [Phytophthora fragariaefolia]
MALPLPTGFDPSKMMQFLASLPKEEQTGLLQGAMDQLGDFQQCAAKSRTREGLVQRFLEARASCEVRLRVRVHPDKHRSYQRPPWGSNSWATAPPIAAAAACRQPDLGAAACRLPVLAAAACRSSTAAVECYSAASNARASLGHSLGFCSRSSASRLASAPVPG